MPRGDGLQRHRVKLNADIELNVFDNWKPEEVQDLIFGILQNWAYYSSPDTILTMNYHSAEVISEEEVKND
jgi:hypothetical protein